MSYVIQPPQHSSRKSRRGRQLATLGLTLCLTLAVVGLLSNFKSLGASDPATPSSAATPSAPCIFTGTPEPSTPTSMSTQCAPGTLDAPVNVEGLVVTLSLSSDQAAPQTVTLTISNSNGKPVDDATVTLVNRHLEMNMGDFVHDLEHTGAGTYSADQVGMGMGGRWQTFIEIARPGQPTVTVVFEESLQGLK